VTRLALIVHGVAPGLLLSTVSPSFKTFDLFPV
jgi:hypothetical protein